MAKYCFELKKTVVQEYLKGGQSVETIAAKYDIQSASLIRRWISVYKAQGEDGLLPCKSKKTYSFDFKMKAVKLYLSRKEATFMDIALELGFNSPAIISSWVRLYNAEGPEALKDKRKRQTAMKKPSSKKKKISARKNKADIDKDQYIKQLEEELKYAKLENAFLKEMRRLRLADEARMRELQESFTASEDNSN